MRKRRRKNNLMYWVITIVVILLFIATGYSLFVDQLNIAGSATTESIYSGNQLNIPLNPNGTMYTGGTLPSSANYQSEVLDANTLTITFVRGNQGNKVYPSSLQINFTNSYDINMTNGSASVVVQEEGNFSNYSAVISKTTLIPNESGTLTVDFDFRNKNAPSPSILRATMQYTVDSYVKYFYYDIVFN